ncbi:MAG: hypothetical protein EPGJADBJ_04884 [Saprospiraceae bacterium]|nr:hypothetical protein [Saprospiraceae bacterium]
MDKTENIYFRLPDFSQNRFFVSPILGCEARCLFCYIYNHGYTTKYRENELRISDLINWLTNHEHFTKGKHGSLISIGAWGDPFPKNYPTATTVDWIEKLCELENPIQVISRFKLDIDTVEKISKLPVYKNQILFSTSISSFEKWQETDNFADSPFDRLQTLNYFSQFDIPTNVMIKPYLPGITDLEIDRFIEEFEKNNVKVCVVGVFYWEDKIVKLMDRKHLLTNEMKAIAENDKMRHQLVCNPNEGYNTFDGKNLDVFCEKLKRNNIVVFKNSTCVNAWLLEIEHPSKLHKNDPLNLCVKCGNCKN